MRLTTFGRRFVIKGGKSFAYSEVELFEWWGLKHITWQMSSIVLSAVSSDKPKLFDEVGGRVRVKHNSLRPFVIDSPPGLSLPA